jgi:hypothetical protein
MSPYMQKGRTHVNRLFFIHSCLYSTAFLVHEQDVDLAEKKCGHSGSGSRPGRAVVVRNPNEKESLIPYSRRRHRPDGSFKKVSNTEGSKRIQDIRCHQQSWVSSLKMKKISYTRILGTLKGNGSI